MDPKSEIDVADSPREEGEAESLTKVSESLSKKINFTVVFVYVLLVVLGLATGFGLSRTVAGGKPAMIKTGKTVGITDVKTFKDSAMGLIEKGGIDGEGTHKLIREGGPSQTAFLISSVIDLDEYVGKKVKVWGETFAAQKAAWLMDVGKIEIQE